MPDKLPFVGLPDNLKSKDREAIFERFHPLESDEVQLALMYYWKEHNKRGQKMEESELAVNWIQSGREQMFREYVAANRKEFERAGTVFDIKNEEVLQGLLNDIDPTTH